MIYRNDAYIERRRYSKLELVNNSGCTRDGLNKMKKRREPGGLRGVYSWSANEIRRGSRRVI